VIKLFLHISKEEQRRRLQSRLDTPDKRWKLTRSDLAERRHWDEYQVAYADALSRTSTTTAPWFVIPSDHKWFRNWVVSHILVDVLNDMDPRYPDPPPLEGVVVT
jgi:polyphosphate kinase 2 (PPK2 family)